MTIFCTLHRVHYEQDCPQCEADDVRLVLEGRPLCPADTIRRMRRVAGLTHHGLAQKAGLARSAVHKWESLGVQARIDLFVKAADACGYRVVLERK